MLATNRKTVRKNFASILSAELVDNQGLAQAVYDYQVGDFGGQSPVVVVSSGGTIPTRFSFSGTKYEYYLDLYTFILYADTTGSWTEEDAENALDNISSAIFDVVDRYQVTADWESIETERLTEIGSVEIGGVEYRREVTRIRIC